MFLAKAQLTNKAFTDAGKWHIKQSLTALVLFVVSIKQKCHLWKNKANSIWILPRFEDKRLAKESVRSEETK